MSNEQIQEWIERYSLGEMSVEEREHFEATLQESAELRRLYREHKAFIRTINHQAAKQLVHNQLAQIKQEQSSTIKKLSNSMQVHINKYWKIASVAAAVAVISSIGTMMFTKQYYKQSVTSEVLSLNRQDAKDIRALSAKVKALDSAVGNILPDQPQGDAKRAGTCFALNNHGYAITNAHVVAGSNSIYVFTKDNIAHKATVIERNEDLDIAVLKVETKGFKFSKVYDVPYSISGGSSAMANDVYTLGYPKNSIVYNRGYVSSMYGRDDDSSRYQLELPSSRGVSGSPVFDKRGNVIAVINSKESIGGGTTYALKSNKLKQFINGLDSIKLSNGGKLNGMTTSEQIAVLEDFVLVVKAY